MQMTIDFSLSLVIQKKREILGQNPDLFLFFGPEKTQNSGSQRGPLGTLRSDPIQTQFNYVKVERPPNIYGTFGTEDREGLVKLSFTF